MRYFTKELWQQINSRDPDLIRSADSAWHQNLVSYRTQVEALEGRVSKKTFRFFTRESLHDSRLVEWTVGDAIGLETQRASLFKRRSKPPAARIRVISYRGDTVYELSYTGVQLAQFDFPTSQPRFWTPGDPIDDWGYDELSAVDDLHLQHEALFASGATMRIVFERFNYHRWRV